MPDGISRIVGVDKEKSAKIRNNKNMVLRTVIFVFPGMVFFYSELYPSL